MDITKIINQYHKALEDFVKGNSQPLKNLFSHQEDIVLANPWGPHVVGWKKVSERLDLAASKYKDGSARDIETIANYSTDNLVTIYELEKWNAKVSGGNEISTFDLRVTSTFGMDGDDWKIIHRHADPITTDNPQGPLHHT